MNILTFEHIIKVIYRYVIHHSRRPHRPRLAVELVNLERHRLSSDQFIRSLQRVLLYNEYLLYHATDVLSHKNVEQTPYA